MALTFANPMFVAKAMQEAFDEPYIRLSIDDFINMMSEKLIKDDQYGQLL